MSLMPGVLRCGGGPGPDTVDWEATIADWVENGKPPDQVIARNAATSVPISAACGGDGSGSADDAANFVCR